MNTQIKKVLIAVPVMMVALTGFSGTAAAHSNVDFSLSIGVPGVVYQPAYVPPPAVVYVPRPAYYPPAYYSPGYYRPREYWDGDRHRDWERREWHERHWHHDRDDD